jgi:hypothetical protein
MNGKTVIIQKKAEILIPTFGKVFCIVRVDSFGKNILYRRSGQ